MPRPIYLDNHATTPVDPRVVEAMRPYFSEIFGNPSSAGHIYGWEAKAAVDDARARIAAGIGAKDPESVIFTSGTTEANNLAIKGVIDASGEKKAHIITQTTEHPSVLEPVESRKRRGHEVTVLPVSADGNISPEALTAALKPNTVLVSVMTANNEIGTIHDITALVKIVRARSKALFHTDSAQAVGKIPLNVTDWDVDLMSFSAHKIYGPKGIGCLYIAPRRPKIRLLPLLHGGGHELGLRAGTLNVSGIVGIATALELCLGEMTTESARLAALSYQLVARLTTELDHCRVNGPMQNRLPGNANLFMQGTPADDVLTVLKGVALSSGSACSSGGPEPSHVLMAIGRKSDEAKASLRIGLGRFTTAQEIETAGGLIIEAVRQVREKSLAYRMLVE